MEKAEIMQSRRQFLKKSLTVAAGLAVTSKMGSLATALAEEPTATATPEPYKWIPSAPPCKLIEEITAADAPEGTRSFKFTTDGRTCSKSVTFDIVGGDYIQKSNGLSCQWRGSPFAHSRRYLETWPYRKSDHFFLSGRKVRFNGECITQVRVYIRRY